MSTDELERLSAIGRFAYLVAVLAQDFADECANGRVIFHHEYLRHSRTANHRNVYAARRLLGSTCSCRSAEVATTVMPSAEARPVKARTRSAERAASLLRFRTSIGSFMSDVSE